MRGSERLRFPGSWKSHNREICTPRIRARQLSRGCPNTAGMTFAEDKRVLCAAGCVQTDRSTSSRFLTQRDQTRNKRRHCPSNLSFPPSFWLGREKMSPIYYSSHRWRVCKERIQPNASTTKPLVIKGSKNTTRLHAALQTAH